MSKKLLLADDSITIQKVVGIIFANEDYELSIVDNGNAALTKASEIKPDVMLVDAIMPGKTGYEVCEAIRLDPLLKYTPILLLTGAFEPFDEDQARASGVDDFISKPFESQHLIEKVKDLLKLGKERASAPPAAMAPVAAVEQFAAPASDLWGEAPAVSPRAAAPAIAAQAATTDLADMFSFEEDNNVSENAFTTELVTSSSVTDASPSDDLWGAFDIEEVPEGDTGEVTAVVEVPGDGFESDAFSFADLDETPTDMATVTGEAELGAFSFAEEDEETSLVVGEEDEPFSFAEDEEYPAAAPTKDALSEQIQRVGSEWEPVGEQAFSFADDPAGTEPLSFADGGTFSAPPPEEYSISLEKGSPFTMESAADKPAASGVFEAPPAHVATAATAPVSAPVTAPPAATGTMTLNEDQLAALVARISKDIIERIVWEVVPDLAEALIKEEIRKIKDGQ